ncbi:MAG: biopolymer transporter ExbD [Oleispira sp.]|nr:biopolymer transporter ExbD [Oleispira sp.]
MRRHKRMKSEADLDITSFMNLMIILVPVLLLNMVFAQTSVLDLKLPLGDSVGSANPEDISVEVTIRKTGMQVAVAAGGASRVIGDIPVIKTKQNYKKLSEVLQQVKKKFPDKRDVILLSTPEIDYQTLVAIMDTARTFETVVAASLVDAVLFPEVSLGDALAIELVSTEVQP